MLPVGGLPREEEAAADGPREVVVVGARGAHADVRVGAAAEGVAPPVRHDRALEQSSHLHREREREKRGGWGVEESSWGARVAPPVGDDGPLEQSCRPIGGYGLGLGLGVGRTPPTDVWM